MKAGEWKRSKFVGIEVYGKTVGVIGLGKIGREVAKRLLAMEMRVVAYDPFLSVEQAAELGIRLLDLDGLYTEADFITVHVPKLKETSGMIGAEAFSKMRDGVRVVNVARGGIIQEKALLDALASGKVAAAALDPHIELARIPEELFFAALIVRRVVSRLSHRSLLSPCMCGPAGRRTTA
jgi:D-3-phosphoglycerate dehydrogenase